VSHIHMKHMRHIYIYIYMTYMAFPVVMYGCESWTIKKAER